MPADRQPPTAPTTMKTFLLILTTALLVTISTPATARDWCGFPSHHGSVHYHSYRYYPGVIGWPYSYSYYRAPSYYYYSTPAPVYYYRTVSPYYASYSLAADVQAALAREGYYYGVVDGIIGSQSRRAICRYQADYGLRVTGSIDGSLLRSLGLD